MPSPQEIKALEVLGMDKWMEQDKLYLPRRGYQLDSNGRVTGLSLPHASLVNTRSLSAFSALQSLLLWRASIPGLILLSLPKSLHTLCLNSTRIHDLSPLEKLQNLRMLDLTSTQVQDLSPLQGLRSLRSLLLSGTQVQDLSPLQDLQNLQTLFLDSTQVQDLSPLQNLQSLQTLFLNSTQVQNLSPVQNLRNLETLSLSRAQIQDLSPLEPLVSDTGSLKRVYARSCRVTTLSRGLLTARLPLSLDRGSGDGIFLGDNPLVSPPAEVIRQGQNAVASYAASLRGAVSPLNEARVLLIGDGGAGKTSLVRYLKEKDFQENLGPTEGIRISPWRPVKDSEGRPITAHLWDFGGQEILHATHQFFLSHRSLYLVMLDGRREEKPEYWLQHVQAFGGNSPVLVVLNKQDQQDGYDVDRATLKRAFPNIVDFFQVSCKSQLGLQELRERLAETLRDLPLLKVPFAENWRRVKETLAAMEDDYIGYGEYKKLCDRNGINDFIDRTTLLEFLDQLGIVLYFSDLELSETQVLRPEWLTQGVYRVLNSPLVSRNDGVLTRQMLREIFTRNEDGDLRYDTAAQYYIVKMMERFELCYALEKNQGWLLPDQLPRQEPADLLVDPSDPAQLIYEYSLLPANLFVRLMVQLRIDITKQWRTGMVLQDPSFGVTAMVLEERARNRLSLWIAGDQKRDYLAILRKTLDDLNRSYQKIDAEMLIPLPDHPNELVSYADLLGHERTGWREYRHGPTGTEYRVAELLNSVVPRKEREEVSGGEKHIHFHANQVTNVQAQAIAQSTATVNFQFALQNLQSYGSTVHNLREDLLDEVEGTDREKLTKELDRVESAVQQLEITSDPEKAKTSPALQRLETFIGKIEDADSRVGKAMKAVGNAVGTAQKLGRVYNNVADWCGAPQIPRFLVKERK
jgi:internalin A